MAAQPKLKLIETENKAPDEVIETILNGGTNIELGKREETLKTENGF